MMLLRRLNPHGLEIFRQYLEKLQHGFTAPPPLELLENPKTGDVIEPAVEVEAQSFGTRYAMAEYLYQRFHESGLSNIEQDKGLWAWLALFYFDELCPEDKRGHRRPGEEARWILNPTPRRYYRHLVAGAYFVYRQHADHPERTLAMLCGPLHILSDVYRVLAGSQQLVTNPTVVETATRLYYNPDKQKLKANIAGDKPGGVRRLAEVLAQFDCTYDLYSLTMEELLDLLPKEFDRFKSGWQSTFPKTL